MKAATTPRYAVFAPLACCLVAGTTLVQEPARPAPAPQSVVPAFRTETEIAAPNPTHRIVHILNVHFVDRHSFIAELAHTSGRSLTEHESELAYNSFVTDLERFQAEQAAVLESCLRDFGVDRVFIEGWTVEDAELFRLIAKVLWRHDDGPVPGPADDLLRFRRLEFGPAARLWAEGRIAAIEPAESQALLAAASPFDADGNFRGLTVETRVAREDYIVRRLLETA